MDLINDLMRFYEFHGFQGSKVKELVVPNVNGVLPLENALLDPSWLLLHRFSWISHLFSDDFMDFMGSKVKEPVVPNANGVLPLKKPLLDPSWLLWHGFIDFNCFQ